MLDRVRRLVGLGDRCCLKLAVISLIIAGRLRPIGGRLVRMSGELGCHAIRRRHIDGTRAEHLRQAEKYRHESCDNKVHDYHLYPIGV